MEVRESSAKHLTTLTSGTSISEWKVLTLGTVANIERGKFSARPRNDPRLYGGDIPFLQTGDIAHSRGRIRTFSQTLNASGLKVSRLFSEGTLFFTIAANIGDVGISSFAAACPDSLVAISPADDVSTEWLFHELASRKSDFEKLASPGAQLNINLEKLRPYLLNVPPTKEQREIANALTDADSLIDSLEQLLTKKRQLKQGIMQELLSGRRRLPGFDGKWGVIELRQLGDFIRGVAYNPTKDLSEGDTEQTVRLLRSNNVQGSEVVRVGLQFVNRRRVRSDQYLQSNDLLLCMANGSRDLVGKTGRFVDLDEHRYTFGAFMGCYRPNSATIDPRFISFHFQTHDFRQHVDLLLAGSSINNLSPEGVLSFTFHKPNDPSEQFAIAQVLSDMETDITCLESRLTKARDLKQAMAQALLTGRIRLVEPKP